MPLKPGSQLGPYEIVAAVGAGGMGEVYRARDTRLDRTVAIKVSHAAFTERVLREARAVAALNDPHICQIYDVGPDYLVMEFVEGASPRPTNDTAAILLLALQLTEGLVAAHAAGIVHRDLKPGNILVTQSGRAKILDFGLASMATRPIAPDDVTAPATTQAGTLAGTLAYMSPEQARGEKIDVRSDLWSLGVVLYELATGVHPFEAATPPLVLEAILNRPPRDVRELNPRIPPGFGDVIARLLEKDPDLRYQSAADLRADLKRIERDSYSTGAAPGRRRPGARRGILPWVAPAAVVAAIAAAAWWFTRPEFAPIRPADYVQLTHFTDSATAPALSPDGRMVAFIRGGGWFLSSGQIFVKLLPNGDAVRLTARPEQKLGPVFTPDGSRIAYTVVDRSVNPPSWDTWTVAVNGGHETRLLRNAAAMSWLDERRVLFSEIRPPGIHMGIATSTETRADHRQIYFPPHVRAMAHYSWPSPDRSWLLVVQMDGTSAWEPCRLVPMDGSSAVRQIGPSGRCIAAAWSPDGAWMYFNVEVDSAFHIWRQRFPDGQPEQITFGPTEEEGIAMAPDGRSLVTSIGARQSAVWIHDARGERALTTEGFAFAPKLSRDLSRVYYLHRPTPGLAGELFAHHLESGTTERVLPGLAISDFDLSPDGTEVAFTTKAPGESTVSVASLDRRSAPRQVATRADEVSFVAGGDLVFRSLGANTNVLGRVRRDGSDRRQIGDHVILNKLGVSPDGEWVLTFIAEGGEAYTVAIPLHEGAPVRICNPFCHVSWSMDGRTLFVVVQGDGSGDPSMTPGTGRTLAIPVPAGRATPDLPPGGITLGAAAAGPPGTEVIERAIIAPGADPSTYAFVVTQLQRNLYRIPLK